MNDYEKNWRILRFLVIGAFLSPLDYFIVNMALPIIRTSFNASDNELQMVIAIYGLTYAALVVCSGKLGDIYGRKNVFITGLWIFLFSSMACAFSPTIKLLIVSRFLQGIGASLLAPQVLSSIRILFNPDERTKAMGFFGAVFGLAAIIGQLLGGFLLNLKIGGFTWELVFLVNIPITAICLWGVYTYMDKEEVDKQKIDIAGVVLIISALILFITPLIYGRQYHWNNLIIMALALSPILTWLFIRHEIKREKANLPVIITISLFKNKNFSYHLPIILLYNFTAGLFICYPYYLQTFLHWDVLRTGIAILPYGIGFFIGPILFSKIHISIPIWIKVALFLLISSFCLLGVTFYLYKTPNYLVNSLFALAGLGHGIIMPTMMKESIKHVEISQAGQGSGIISTTIQIGSVLGGVIIGTLFFSLQSIIGYKLSFALALSTIGILQIPSIIFLKQLNNKN